jgi:hypothetical protein
MSIDRRTRFKQVHSRQHNSSLGLRSPSAEGEGIKRGAACRKWSFRDKMKWSFCDNI